MFPGAAGAQSAAGVLRGKVTDNATKAAVSGVTVSATSPGAHYTTTTDARGEYTFLGIQPDTYTLSFTSTRYASLSIPGITVLSGTVQSFDVALTFSLRTIAAVKSKPRTSAGSAFQPGMTIDNYTVTDRQIQLVQGKEFNVDENQLLRSIPSVTIDKSGTVSIRGGFAFEAGYEFEGIDYTTPTPNLQNALQNIGNFGLLNGVGSVQLIPGAGDATHGNTGTGLVLLTAKHGEYPGTLHADFEMYSYPYLHQLGLEWGIGDPNQRITNFASFLGVRRNYQYGLVGTAANTLGTLGGNAASLGSEIDPNLVYYSPEFLSSNDFVDNLIYRFGKNQRQRLQFFVQKQDISQQLDYGGYTNLFYASGGGGNGQCSQFLIGSGNTNAQNLACESLIPLYPGQPSTSAYVTSADRLSSPFLAYKFEYGANVGKSALLTARYYRTWAEQEQQLPSQGIFASPYGGARTAFTLDISAARGSKHLLKGGGSYGYTAPFGDRYDYSSYTSFTANPDNIIYPLLHGGLAPPIGTTPPNFNPGVGNGGLTQDFFSPAQCAQAAIGSPIVGECGYLYQYLPNGSRFPAEHDVFTADQQVYSAYLQDDVTFSDRWKSELGIRLDGYNNIFPSDPSNPPAVDSTKHQRLYEPHVNLTLSPSARDEIRLGYGRTLSVPLASQLGQNITRDSYSQYANVPSFDNRTGLPATYCGPTANTLCASYADQLYWLTRDYRFGGQSLTAPLHGATFTNYDLSWAHQFRDGSALKVTPFFRRGYDVIEDTAQIIGFNSSTGAPIYGDISYSNLGQQKATGVELLYTKERTFGLSAQIGATYINQFGNEPPGTYLTPAALQAGLLYRSPDLSPFQINIALQNKNKSGWRFNGVVGLNVGYPYGAGYYTAVFCNGHAVIVPSSDLASFFSTATGYVDPQFPGTCTDPNIAATRGNKEPALPGGALSAPRVNATFTMEYQRPGTTSVYGLQVQNLTNGLYNTPTQNTCYGTPVTTGLTYGTAPCTFSQPQYGNPGQPGSIGNPYLVLPNLPPLNIRLYYQVRI